MVTNLYKIWVGPNPMPDYFEKYINTWSVLDLQFQIVEIGNNSVDECFSKTKSLCLRWAINNNKWTVINHYLRYWLMYTKGGLYLDLDVQVIRPLSIVGDCVVGMESERWVNNHAMYAEPGHPLFRDAMDYMDNTDLSMLKEVELDTGPRLISNLIFKNTIFKPSAIEKEETYPYGDRTVTILPERMMSGHRWYQKFNPNEIKEDTFCVHHYTHSWK
jgi:mannosyltransferase OCH1-like enzyme